MMKKLFSLLLIFALLTTCALADWDDVQPLGNDRVGYIMPSDLWITMRSSNLSDETIAAYEEQFGFTQYMGMANGMMILTMANYGDAARFGEDELEQLMSVANGDYGYMLERVGNFEPQAELRHVVLGEDVSTLLLYGFDLDGYGEPIPVVFYYFIVDGQLLHYEFEHVYEDQRDYVLDLMRTWTPDLPAQE